jgi:catechol 2,3-dioxygenase-like lactoylglutathione lyase family enzyme
MKDWSTGGWISAADCVDFYAAVFGWEVKRWFHNKSDNRSTNRFLSTSSINIFLLSIPLTMTC